MNKREFLNELKEYLSYELPAALVKEKVAYYSDYIDKEAAGGRKTDEIIEDLGDPQLIARSIIDAAKSGPDGIPGTGDDIDFSGEMFGQPGTDDAGYDAYGGAAGSGSYGDGGTGSSRRAYGSDAYGTGTPEDRRPGNMQVYNFGCFGAILAMLIFISVLTLIGGLLGALSPYLAPLCMVCLILWLLGRSGRGGGGW